MKGRTAGFAGAGDRARVCLCLRVCKNHSLRGVSEGTWCRGSEAYFRSWAVFDGGDLFSAGLYMVAPRLAEGALRNVADLSKKTGLERARSERDMGEGFRGQKRLEASVIRIIAMFLVLVSASPVFARRPHIQIQPRNEWHSSLLCLNLENSSNPNPN